MGTYKDADVPLGVRVYDTPSAYEQIQHDFVNRLSEFTRTGLDEIKTIVIVGAYWGLEIAALRSVCPRAWIYAFEANPEHYAKLKELHGNEPKVRLYNFAIGEKRGRQQFTELTQAGCGSLCNYQGHLFGSPTSIRSTFEVEVFRILDVPDLKDREIDVLWVDVQGAELQVLKGADLSKVNAMFLEIKTHHHLKPSDAEPYVGQCFLPDLIEYTKQTHVLESVGLDNENQNGTGNSIWIRKGNKMKLSLLICSLEQRQKYLQRLADCLKPQLTSEVEVLVCTDRGERTIGEKRNQLLQKATGEYIAFIDDDDLVSPDYITKILNAVETNPDVVGMSLIMYTDGVNPQRSTHSLQYKDWWDEPDPADPRKRRYYRNPNHLNPVKRELAVRTGFPHNSMGEDRDYSHRLLSLLKTEVFIPEPIYFYMCRSFKEC